MLPILRYATYFYCVIVIIYRCMQTFQGWMNAFRAPQSYNGLSYDTQQGQSSFFGGSTPATPLGSYYGQAFTQQPSSSSLLQPQATPSSTSSTQQDQDQFDKDRYKAREQVSLKYRNSMQLPQRPCWYEFRFAAFAQFTDVTLTVIAARNQFWSVIYVQKQVLLRIFVQ